ncbi:hypothetical protein NQ314_018316 [Rhamnusium bicolor]|uniref:Uncharacterized protein n=1 Tax=Rhamnusium bicolor TaxID=1586634 RepID=A0AAV8WS30_9CUCU|nr:hypothetical protein NQ314_018316 [Rhamnusium bicolor]
MMLNFMKKVKGIKKMSKRGLKRLRKIVPNRKEKQKKVDATLKQMEAAAMAAYRRDVESNANADLTSIAINKKNARRKSNYK